MANLEAQRISENALFKSAFEDRSDEQIVNEANENREWVEHESQVTGMDGEPLGDEEGMARAIEGDGADPNNLTDRPLQYQFELDVARKLMQKEGENAMLVAQNQQLRQQYDPEARAEAELAKAEYLDRHGLFSVDEAKTNAFLQQQAMLEQQRTETFNRNGLQSIERARAKYGRAYDEVDRNFERLDPNNPMARTAAQHIYQSPDPGEALMNAADTIATLVDPQNGWQRHPHLQGGRSAPRSSRREFPRPPDEQMNSGWGDAEQEREVYNGIWENY